MVTQLTVDLFMRCAEMRGNVNLEEMLNSLDCCKELLSTLLREPLAVPTNVAPTTERFNRTNPEHLSMLSAWAKERAIDPAWRRQHAETLLNALSTKGVPADLACVFTFLDAYYDASTKP